jgi:uroporphyrinogen-III synthase
MHASSVLFRRPYFYPVFIVSQTGVRAALARPQGARRDGLPMDNSFAAGSPTSGISVQRVFTVKAVIADQQALLALTAAFSPGGGIP